MREFCVKSAALVAACATALFSVWPAYAGPHDAPTKTPIKHVIVIFQENVSFDHYFGTYPHAANLPGETPFHPKDDTPRANTLQAAGLLTNNANAINPFRIPLSVPVTCDEDYNNYNDEQAAFHGGLMDNFTVVSCTDALLGKFSTMGYYDGGQRFLPRPMFAR